MTTYKSKGVPVPEPSDQNDPPAYVGALADWVNDRPGIQSMTTTQRDALTGANLWAGRTIFNTTTQRLELNRSGNPGATYWGVADTISDWQPVTPTLWDSGGNLGSKRIRSWGNSALYFQRRLVRDLWQVRGWVVLGSTCDLVLGGSNWGGITGITFPDFPPWSIAVLPVMYHQRATAGIVQAGGQLIQQSDEVALAIDANPTGGAYNRLTVSNIRGAVSNVGIPPDYVTPTTPWDWAAGDVIAVGSGFLA